MSLPPAVRLMRWPLVIILLATANSAQAQFYASGEALFLDQLNGDQTVLSQRVTMPAGMSAVLFTDSVNGSMQPGVEVTLGFRQNDVTAVELTYFGLHDWNESASVTDPAENLQAPFSNGGLFTNTGQQLDDFFDAFQQGIEFSSEMHNIELNVRRQLTGPLWFVAGIRYIDYDETMNFFSVDDAGAGSDVGRYNVSVDNQLLGLQVGGDATYSLTSWLEVTGKAKAGMFVNWVDQETLLQNTGPNLSAQGGKSDTGLASVIDVEMMFAARRGPWTLFAGYRALVHGGMAKAGDQFDFSINEDPAAVIGNVDHQGTLVLHGPFGGLMGEY